MKKSELRKLIREMISEQIGPYPNPPKKPRPNVSPVYGNQNQIGPATPILGYNCIAAGPATNQQMCQPVYDIPMNAGVQPEFANFAECMDAGCYPPPADMPPAPSKRKRRTRR